MQKTENKIYSSIRGKGAGCVITNSDFYHLAARGTINRCLTSLRERGIIRSLIVGIYDYPIYSELLQEQLAPDIDLVAQAIARKNQWHIQITGDAALNYLGLSTQVPGRYVYLSDAQSREYQIMNRTLEFKRAPLKQTKFQSRQTEIITQALIALGEANVDAHVISQVSAFIAPKERYWILGDTRYAPAWIGELLRKLITEATVLRV
ncbi:MAG: hypothetical protein IKJ94_02980 [Oscillospiraceae bacterium]|nr:hypothetical protein [Oscillospiraceae bacterium]